MRVQIEENLNGDQKDDTLDDPAAMVATLVTILFVSFFGMLSHTHAALSLMLIFTSYLFLNCWAIIRSMTQRPHSLRCPIKYLSSEFRMSYSSLGNILEQVRTSVFCWSIITSKLAHSCSFCSALRLLVEIYPCHVFRSFS